MRKPSKWYRDQAEKKYAKSSDGDIEVGLTAQISHGDGGAFVQAWVWVAGPDDD